MFNKKNELSERTHSLSSKFLRNYYLHYLQGE